MLLPKEIIDNSEGNKLVTFLNNMLEEYPQTNLDIATAFFNVQAYAMVKDNLNGVKRFRLLLGKAPEIKSQRTLGDELLSLLKEEVEGFELSKEKENTVKDLIDFLKKDNVEIGLYDKEFLHGKAYIFDNLVVIGSSNFTASGLTHNTELNAVSLEESKAIYTREKWFEKFWAESNDFKEELIQLLEDSRFGSTQYQPYEIYMKALYELQKEELKAEEKKDEKTGRPPTKVNLAEFQDDAVERIMSRLEKYGAILVADSVGLGKTWIAKKILEEIGYYERRCILVICPAQLKSMWKTEMKKINIAENIMSQEELASEEFLQKAKKAVGGKLSDVDLIVVDESHNFRNPMSNRWENLFTLVHDNIAKKGDTPYIMFLTATPINNTIWDLYWQIMLLVSTDRRAFMKENIPDLFQFFKDVDKRGDPSLLNDLLNEISIRRTRDYIKANYPDAYILREYPNGEVKEEKIIFPERELENVSYELDKTYMGMYKWISDIITEKLTMAYYRLLEYKKEEKRTPEEEMALGRMIALDGIFRTLLLKRLESSVEAFRTSIRNHIKFLNRLKDCLNKGKLLTKKSFISYVMREDEELDEVIESLEKIELASFKKEELFADIDKDISLLKEILKKVQEIEPKDDAKLTVLKDKLLTLSQKSQVIVFTYYSDTLNYIHENCANSKEFRKLKIEKISGKTPPNERERIVNDFLSKKIDVLMSTDVLSEGMNLQSAQIVLNYDLHWNPTRMIQRAGRIDRIGSPYKKIYVYNFFPEDELEELLRLVRILQNKIIDIDKSVGLDQSILGEEIHPKVFGIMRRIKGKDSTVLAELERDVFGGGEKFYQPLKDFLKTRAMRELEKIPYGVFSGLRIKKISGIFFYYKYGNDSHYWYLYDVTNGELKKSKTEIIDFIACPPEEKRVIPDFFEKIYEINRSIVEDIEKSFKEIEQKQTTDSILVELSRDRSTKFVGRIVAEIEHEIDDYLTEFPEDKQIEEFWEPIKNKMLSIPYTKKRLRELRRIWRNYKKEKDWKKLMKNLNDFLWEKGIRKKEPVGPLNRDLLKLVVIDLVS
jgi:superfamily II DNA or RNA helicase